MQDQDMPDPGRVLDEMQRCVLCVLLAPTGCGLCSMHELAVAIGDHEEAEVAVSGCTRRVSCIVSTGLCSPRARLCVRMSWTCWEGVRASEGPSSQ